MANSSAYKPRINFFEQLKAFYEIVWHGEHDFKPQHISLYFFLVNQNNRNNWAEWFKVPFDLGMKGACLGSKKTYYKILGDLTEWGLIKYVKGANEWRSPMISIVVQKCTSSDTASVPQLLPLELPQVSTQGGRDKDSIHKDPLPKDIKGSSEPIESIEEKFLLKLKGLRLMGFPRSPDVLAKYLKSIKARLKIFSEEEILIAVEKNSFLLDLPDVGWFDIPWVLKNNENIEKMINGRYNCFKKKAPSFQKPSYQKQIETSIDTSFDISRQILTGEIQIEGVL